MEKYSKEEIQKKIMQYHNIDGMEKLKGLEGARKAMQKLRSIQYDPLNVVGRNADLVLQARVQQYRQEDLRTMLYKEHSLIDGYDKEMCIYTAEDFGTFAPVREERTKSVKCTLANRNQLGALELLNEVHEFVKQNGRTGTKDISIGDTGECRWGHRKLSSAALDYLFNQGDLCVVDRRGTQKYYDLTERILPFDYLQEKEMSKEEFLEWYMTRRIRSVGLVRNKSCGAWLGHFLNKTEEREEILKRLIQKDVSCSFYIDGIQEEFFACKEFFADRVEEQRNYARFLAPLDNLLWDRTLIQKVFHFDYQWEVYTPVVKRKFGYYVLPVVYNNQFVARFEPEPVNQAGCLRIKNWWWEPGIKPGNQMINTIKKEMLRFSQYLQVDLEKREFL